MDSVLLRVAAKNHLNPSTTCEYHKKVSYLNQEMTPIRHLICQYVDLELLSLQDFKKVLPTVNTPSCSYYTSE